MERVLTSRWFLASTAVCCGLAVAFSVWAVGGASAGARALAGLIGLAASLAVMLLIAAASADETPVASVAVPAVAVESVAQAPAPSPRVLEGQAELTRLLDEGRGLREELAPGSADPRVDSWIEEVRSAIEGWRPGVAGYFNALGQRTYSDDGLRLDAYARRLETVVRDY